MPEPADSPWTPGQRGVYSEAPYAPPRGAKWDDDGPVGPPLTGSQRAQVWVLALVNIAVLLTGLRTVGVRNIEKSNVEAAEIFAGVAVGDAVLAQEAYRRDHDAYTRFLTDLSDEGLDLAEDTTLGVARSDATGYCLDVRVRSGGGAYDFHYDSADKKLRQGSC